MVDKAELNAKLAELSALSEFFVKGEVREALGSVSLTEAMRTLSEAQRSVSRLNAAMDTATRNLTWATTYREVFTGVLNALSKIWPEECGALEAADVSSVSMTHDWCDIMESGDVIRLHTPVAHRLILTERGRNKLTNEQYAQLQEDMEELVEENWWDEVVFTFFESNTLFVADFSEGLDANLSCTELRRHMGYAIS